MLKAKTVILFSFNKSSSTGPGKKDRVVYQALVIGSAWTYDFDFTQRTLSQLHNEGFALIRKKQVVDAVSNLESNFKLFSPIIDQTQSIQPDIDISSYAFLDGTVDYFAGKIAFENPLFVKLNLSEVPETAPVNRQNRNAMEHCADKLDKYGYYLRTAVRADYEIFNKEIAGTIATTEKGYNFK